MNIFKEQFNRKVDKDYIRKRLNLESIKKQADELCEYEFSFLRPWDMEPCLKVYSNHDLDWNLVANDDEEWTFMLNRFDYLQALVLTYEVTHEDKYRDTVMKLISDWIGKHEVIEYSLATRTLDTAIRIDAWIHALIRISQIEPIEDAYLEMVHSSVLKQIDYMHNSYLTKYTLSNWGSIQTSVIIKLFPILNCNYMQHPIYQWAIQEFEVQMGIQIYDDGLLWEQSTMYHVEVLKHFLKVYKVKPSVKLKSLLKNMVEALIHLADSNYIIEAFGDSDRSSIIDVVSIAAVILQDSDIKLFNDTIRDAERLYEMSHDEVLAYEAMQSTINLENYFDGFDSGIHTVRQSWSKDSNYWMYSNGSLGSGHGHSDNQHISYYASGKPLLVDGGRYTYREDINARAALKGPYYHNSLTLKSRTLSVPDGSWSYHQFVNVTKNYAAHKDMFHYFEGMINKDDFQHTRRILLCDQGVTLIIDDVYSEIEDTVSINFNIDHLITPKLTAQGVVLDEYILDQRNHMETKIVNSLQSTKYNELLENKRVVFEAAVKQRQRFATLLYPKSTVIEEVEITQGDNLVLSSDVGRAFKINNDYTFVVICEEIYKGTKILKCEGHYFHAKAVVIDHKQNTVQTL